MTVADYEYRLGVDENGLGSRLGPLVVTGILARVSRAGAKYLARPLRGQLASDLDDSKALVAHGNIALSEAWARSFAPAASTPAQLFAELSLEGLPQLERNCPPASHAQCFHTAREAFTAEGSLCARITGHRRRLAARGVHFIAAVSSVLCVQRLNGLKRAGISRSSADLHAMEYVVLELAARARAEAAPATASLRAVCGKVGGMSDYPRFFGPLAGQLHVELERSPARSRYHFPGLGELAFVRDADGSDPLVMLASMVGKYVRELLMARITSYYPEASAVSGYHDPLTARFVQDTVATRRHLGVIDDCFERLGNNVMKSV